MLGIKLATIYGSPSPPGRLYSVLIAAEEYADNQGAQIRHVEPATYQSGKFLYWEEESLNYIEGADAILIASPVFRGSIPAILKDLFDTLPVRALRSKPVGLYVVGNVEEHYLGVERHITDILTWFGALYVPATSYIISHSLNEGVPEQHQEQIEQLVNSTLTLAASIKGKKFDPPPLAEIHGR